MKKSVLAIALVTTMSVTANEEGESISKADELRALAAESSLKTAKNARSRAKAQVIQSMSNYCKLRAEEISIQMDRLDYLGSDGDISDEAVDRQVKVRHFLDNMVDGFLGRCRWLLK